MSELIDLSNGAVALLIKKKDAQPDTYKGIKIFPRRSDGKPDFDAKSLIIWRTDLEILLEHNRWANVGVAKPFVKDQ